MCSHNMHGFHFPVHFASVPNGTMSREDGRVRQITGNHLEMRLKIAVDSNNSHHFRGGFQFIIERLRKVSEIASNMLAVLSSFTRKQCTSKAAQWYPPTMSHSMLAYPMDMTTEVRQASYTSNTTCYRLHIPHHISIYSGKLSKKAASNMRVARAQRVYQGKDGREMRRRQTGRN